MTVGKLSPKPSEFKANQSLPSAATSVPSNFDAAIPLKQKNLTLIKDLFFKGIVLFRAVCIEELKNRIISGANPRDDDKKSPHYGTYKYASTTAPPQENARCGMRLFGNDLFGLIIDPTGATINTKTADHSCTEQIIAFYTQNASTKYKQTRAAKQAYSNANNPQNLADQLNAIAMTNDCGTLRNSEVLWAGIEPNRIKGLLVRIPYGNFDMLTDEQVNGFLQFLKGASNLYSRAIHEDYPVFYYYEGTPHGLVQLTITATTTAKQVKQQIAAAMHVFRNPLPADPQYEMQNRAQLKARAAIDETVVRAVPIQTQYTHGDKQRFERLKSIGDTWIERRENYLALQIATLLEKFMHGTLGPVRMDNCRQMIEAFLEFYNNIEAELNNANISAQTKVELVKTIRNALVEMHAIIDLDSINSNLYSQTRSQLPHDTCKLLVNPEFPEIIRKQIMYLTNSEQTSNENNRLSINEIVEIVNFINKQDEKDIPDAFKKFDGMAAKWQDINDLAAQELYTRLGGEKFIFTGNVKSESYTPKQLLKIAGDFANKMQQAPAMSIVPNTPAAPTRPFAVPSTMTPITTTSGMPTLPTFSVAPAEPDARVTAYLEGRRRRLANVLGVKIEEILLRSDLGCTVSFRNYNKAEEFITNNNFNKEIKTSSSGYSIVLTNNDCKNIINNQKSLKSMPTMLTEVLNITGKISINSQGKYIISFDTRGPAELLVVNINHFLLISDLLQQKAPAAISAAEIDSFAPKSVSERISGTSIQYIIILTQIEGDKLIGL